jgi:hypothetical protein
MAAPHSAAAMALFSGVQRNDGNEECMAFLCLIKNGIGASNEAPQFTRSRAGPGDSGAGIS